MASLLSRVLTRTSSRRLLGVEVSGASLNTLPTSTTLTTTRRWFSDEAAAATGGESTLTKKEIKKKMKKTKGKTPEGGRDRNLELILRALDAPETKPPKPSEEEAERRFTIGRNYNIGMFQRHNEIQHDLNCKVQMKRQAIKMLPRNSKLKEEAMKIDWEGPPKWRHIPVDTPPIPNFDPSKFIVEEEE